MEKTEKPRDEPGLKDALRGEVEDVSRTFKDKLSRGLYRPALDDWNYARNLFLLGKRKGVFDEDDRRRFFGDWTPKDGGEQGIFRHDDHRRAVEGLCKETAAEAREIALRLIARGEFSK